MEGLGKKKKHFKELFVKDVTRVSHTNVMVALVNGLLFLLVIIFVCVCGLTCGLLFQPVFGI